MSSNILGEEIPKDPDLEISLGRVAGYESIIIKGHNDALQVIHGSKIIWDYQATGWTVLAAAETMDVTSTDPVSDVSTGVGARKITVVGLLAGVVVSEEVIMTAGTNRTTQTYDFVLAPFVSEAGTSLVNVGDIRIFGTGTLSTQGFIQAGEGNPDYALYAVPTGYVNKIQSLYFSADRIAGGNPVVFFKLWKVENGLKTLEFSDQLDTNVDTHFNPPPFDDPLTVNAGGYWWIEAETTANNTYTRCIAETKLVKV